MSYGGLLYLRKVPYHFIPTPFNINYSHINQFCTRVLILLYMPRDRSEMLIINMSRSNPKNSHLKMSTRHIRILIYRIFIYLYTIVDIKDDEPKFLAVPNIFYSRFKNMIRLSRRSVSIRDKEKNKFFGK